MKKNYSFLLFVALFLGYQNFISAQQTNDECSTAIQLTVDITCNYQSFDNTGSTTSTGVPDPGCASFSGSDVWFYFIVPTEGAITVNMNNNNGMSDSGMAWYSGNCSNLTLLDCDDDGSENGLMSKIFMSGLTPNDTIFVRIWGYSGDLGTFEICAQIPPPPPANDECLNAISVGISSDNSCTSEVSGTIESATPSLDTNTCWGSSDDDVWFTFQANNDTLRVGVNDVVGSTTDMIVAVYSGACGSLTQISCNEYYGTDSDVFTNLIEGENYLIRIYSWTVATGQNTTFDVCVSEIPGPPANDDCSGAYSLQVNNDLLCGNILSSSIESATPSLDTNTCYGTADDDVWFTFQATNTSHNIGFLNAQGSTTDLMIAVYSGTCGTLTQLSCNEFYGQGSTMVNGLTIGENYLVRIYSWTSNPGQNTTFDVCVGTPPPPPANDECSGANPVPVNIDLNCTNITEGTLQSATTSLDTNTCYGTADDDVWFTFQATNTSHNVGFLNAQGSTTDLMIAVYSGACGTLTQLSCNEFYGQGSTMVNGLTIGENYLVRIYSYTSLTGQNTTFDVCVGTPPPPPTNDECSGAYPVTVNIDLNCTNITEGTLQSATPSLDTNTCYGTADDDVWFTFQATNTAHSVGFLNAQGSTTDLMIAVYSGACGTLTQLSCNEFYNQGSSNIGGLTIGENYMIRIYSWTSNSGQNTTFDVCVGTPPPPPTNDECSGAIALNVSDTCSYMPFSNESSTSSQNIPEPGCASYSGGDVWFYFVVPFGGEVTVNSNSNGGITDSGMAWYSGECGSLTLIECDDDDSENGYMSKITRTGLTPGDTIYVRFWGYGNSYGSFEICASAPSQSTEAEIYSQTTIDPSECSSVDGSILVAGVNFTTGTINWTGPVSGTENNVNLPYNITSLLAGSYDIVFDDGVNIDTISVVLNGGAVPNAPIISVSGDTIFCEGQSVTLSSNISNGIVWSPGNQTTSSITVTQSGTYFVTVTENGCTNTSDEVTILVTSSPDVTISPIPNVCDTAQNFSFTQGSPIGGIYTVNGIPTIEFNPGVQYIGENVVVYTYSENGCSDTAQTIMIVEDCSNIGLVELTNSIIVYPNPSNGIVEIKGIEKNEIESILIFDQIGKLVMKSKGLNTLDLSSFDEGQYIIEILTLEKKSTFRVNIIR
ncbi:MAG: T9SS type A sorting domain-containing protein [Flavobacteriia bacterium]|nr:T9SS type A sorting domain-containing protein [Flavobacteriia bacterium]